MDSVIADVGKLYKKKLSSYLTNNPQADEVALNQFNEELRAELLLRISEELQMHYGNAKKKCESQTKKLQQQTKLCLKDCLEDYQKAMTEMVKKSNYLEEDKRILFERHREEKSKACKQLYANCPPSTPDSLKEDCVAKLGEKVEKSFTEILERFETLKNLTEKQMQAIFKSTKEIYHQKMRKQFAGHDYQFVEPAELLGLHEKVVDDVVERYLKPGWTEPQRNALRGLYFQAFRAHEEENDMLLNNAGSDRGSEPAIGVDIGYLNCYVSVYINGKSTMIQNEHGIFKTPAYVALDQDGTRRAVVGVTAKEIANRRPQETIFDLKKMIGKLYSEYKLERNLDTCPFSVVQDEDGSPKVDVNGTRYYPEQIYAALLDELRKQAEFQLGRPMNKVVITAPAYFSEQQREAMKTSGELVGLDVLNVLSEPRAAVLAYKLHRVDTLSEERKVMVLNLERSSFDVTLFNIDCNGMAVLGIDGDRKLGCENFDLKLLDYCVGRFKASHGIDLRDELQSTLPEKKDKACFSLERLYAACETQKEALIYTNEIEIRLDHFHKETITLAVPVSRELFENINANVFSRIMEIVVNVLENADVAKQQVDNIILTGGGTRVRKIHQMLQTFFGGKPLNASIDPTEVTARGAAVHAAILNGAIIRKSLS